MPPPDPTAAEGTAPDERVERLVFDCLQRLESEDEATALAAVCGEDPELLAAVRAGLGRLRDVGLLTARAGGAFPQRLGEFRLLRRLGGGGMGVVYLALQEPLGREVALKLIRPDQLYFPGSRERFQREVAAIASLEHPGVVPIYMVGEADGLPYYAMKRVPGITLAEILARPRNRAPDRLRGADLLAAADDHATDEAARPAVPGFTGTWTEACLRVTLQVAEALVHCHARGVIHRDIKPSNIMLTPDGHAMLLDFGLASSQQPGHITRTGSQPGSLAYMSPEQVRGERLDARTDIYSLGVTLYELLSLVPAHAGDTDEQLREAIIAGQARPLRVLNRRVPWDVETVCLTAMERDRGRRYPDAAAFADDLRRLLESRTITARRPGALLRARRFVRRRPTLTLAVASAAVLIGGVPTALFLQERRARARIEAEAATTREVVDFLVDLFYMSDPERGRGNQIPARTILDRAVRRIQGELSTQPRVRTAMLAAMGTVYRNLGLYAEAEPLLRESLKLREDTWSDPRVLANGHAALGILLQRTSQFAEAEAHMRQALDFSRRVGGEDGAFHVATQTLNLATAMQRRGRDDETLALFEQALALQRALRPPHPRGLGQALAALGAFHHDRGALDLAEPLVTEALALRRQLHSGPHPELVTALHDMAFLQLSRNRPAPAEALFGEAIQMADRLFEPDHPTPALLRRGLARALRDPARREESLGLLQAALASLQATLPPEHRERAFTENDVAECLRGLGRPAQALPHAEAAVRGFRAVYPNGDRELGIALCNLSWLRDRAGRPDAEAAGREGVTMLRRLPLTPPATLGGCMQVLASVLVGAGKASEGEALAGEAIALLEGAGLERTREMFTARSTRAYALCTMGRGAEAEPESARALALHRDNGLPEDPILALTWLNHAWALHLLGRLEPAEEEAMKALHMMERLAPQDRGLHALAHGELGVVRALRRNLPGAETMLRAAVADLAASGSANVELPAMVTINLCRVLELQGKREEAEAVGFALLEARRGIGTPGAFRTTQACQVVLGVVRDHPDPERSRAGLARLVVFAEALLPGEHKVVREIRTALERRAASRPAESGPAR